MLKAKRDLKILEWEMALRVQAAWRGRMAKMLALSMRILQVSTRGAAQSPRGRCFMLRQFTATQQYFEQAGTEPRMWPSQERCAKSVA